MNVLAVIPARYASTRFPAKPLALIAGIPLLQRVVEQVKKSKSLSDIIVATDHPEIESLCKKVSVKSVMTDSELPSGTDRIFQAVQRSIPNIQNDDVIINVQGDEPLIPSSWLESVVAEFKKDPRLQMLTLAHPLQHDELENKNSVKVILNKNDDAIYFSRFSIPHSRAGSDAPISLKHVGLYAYRFATLKKFCEAPNCDLEKSESLEQLRAIYLGIPIRVIKVKGATQGVDVPEDVQKVEKILKTGGVS